MTQKYEAYISEWKTLHPDWEIRRWDETNSPMNLPYLQNAQAHRKWANMSNLVRFYALQQEGGIYLDTDMKVIKPLDALLKNQCFAGFEEGDGEGCDIWVNNAIIGAEKNHPFIRLCYETLLASFDGLEDANLSAPRLITQLLKEKYALSRYGFQVLEDVTLYPRDYFYPVHYNEVYKLENLQENIAETTLAVHMWGRSWLAPHQLLDLLDNLQLRYNQATEQVSYYQARMERIQSIVGDSASESNGRAGNGTIPEASKELLQTIRAVEQGIGEIQKCHAFLFNQHERIIGNQESYGKKIEEQDARLKTIYALGTAYRSKELEYIKCIEELKLENALLKKEVEVKDQQLTESDKIFNGQQQLLESREKDYLSRITELTEYRQLLEKSMEQQEQQLRQKELLYHEITSRLQTALADKDRQLEEISTALASKASQLQLLQEVHVELQERSKTALGQLALDSNKLSSDLAAKEELIAAVLAQLEGVQAEKSELQGLLSSKEKDLATEFNRTKELQERLAALHSEFTTYKSIQSEHNRELIHFLQCKVSEHQNNINWYKATYEQRRLIGVIKDRMFKLLIK